MKIAILSGKGGTGKTLLSVNLAAVSESSVYADCDVEEPNGHLFFKPEKVMTTEVKVRMPRINDDLCIGCRKCVNFCNFNALAFANKVIVFEEICHSCGGCSIVCPTNAISEKDKVIGYIQKGESENTEVITGMMNTGEASGVPIINEILSEVKNSPKDAFIDCPPGSACVVMESIKDADYCILVAEPTLFGSHNLKMVYELVEVYNKPFSVVLNKCEENSYNPSEELCRLKGLDILAKIPYDSELGNICSNGKVVSREKEKYKKIFSEILNKVVKEVKGETVTHP